MVDGFTFVLLHVLFDPTRNVTPACTICTGRAKAVQDTAKRLHQFFDETLWKYVPIVDYVGRLSETADLARLVVHT